MQKFMSYHVERETTQLKTILFLLPQAVTIDNNTQINYKVPYTKLQKCWRKKSIRNTFKNTKKYIKNAVKKK